MYNEVVSKTKLGTFLFAIVAMVLLSSEGKAQTQAIAGVGSYQSGSKIPKAIFSSLPGVGVYVRDYFFEIKYIITSYTVKLADDEGNIRRVTCFGSPFSSLAKQYINDYAKPGDVIGIENIKARADGGQEVKLPALLYYIE